MPFTTALSGLSAASNNLAVTGNNIANANTVGFKKSRSEFADVYAASLGGVSSVTPGAGVRVANVAQQFNQGNLQFTDNNLDLAISGEGFFTLAKSPTETTDLSYTRAGEFKLDKDGYLVNNQGRALLVYRPNGTSISDGFSTGVTQPVQINTLTGLPSATDTINLGVNLDANSSLPPAQLALANAVTSAYANYTTALTNVTAGQLAVTNDYTSLKANLDTYSTDAATTADPGVIAAKTAMTTALATLSTAQNTLNTAQTSLTAAQTATPPDQTTIASAQAAVLIAQQSVTTAQTALTSPSSLATAYLNAINTANPGAAAANPTDLTAITAAQTQTTTDLTSLTTLQAAITPAQTQITTAQANALVNPFDPTDSNTYNSQTSVTIYDSLGSPHILTSYFVKGTSTATQTQWSVYHYMSEPATPDVKTPVSAGLTAPVSSPASLTAIPAAGVLTFDSGGILRSPADGKFALSPYTILPATGAADITISTMNYFGSTQVQQKFSVNSQTQNGLPAGRLTGVDIDKDGVIFARFSNGGSQAVGKVALSRFANVNGLAKLGDTAWGQSANSGEPIRGEAGANNFGLIQSGALEASNVDLSAQLVNLIVAQQAYQANAQTITTENTIMQTILNIR